jgi:hypothetical protein
MRSRLSCFLTTTELMAELYVDALRSCRIMAYMLVAAIIACFVPSANAITLNTTYDGLSVAGMFFCQAGDDSCKADEWRHGERANTSPSLLHINGHHVQRFCPLVAASSLLGRQSSNLLGFYALF